MAAPAAGSGNRPLVRGVAALVVAVVVVVLLLFLLQLQSSPASSVASPTPPPEATLAPVTPPATATPTPIVAPTIYNGPTPSPPPTAPPTPQPTARPHATPRPTPTYLVPTILSFGAPSTVHCTGTETQMVHLTWKIAGGATGVIIGIDNPGEYEQIDQTSGSADVPFACSDDHHDYYITTVGGSGSADVEHRTVTRSM